MNMLPSGKYTKVIELRIERDKLINERHHLKSRTGLCEGQEKIWKEQRRKFAQELKGVNEEIIEHNANIKIEMQNINGSGIK